MTGAAQAVRSSPRGELLAQAGLGAPLRVDAALVGVEGAHLVHVGDDVARRGDRRAEPRGARRAVDEGEGDRQLGGAGDAPEAGLPVLAPGAGALGGEDEQERLAALRLADQLAHHRAGVVAVERDAAEPGGAASRAARGTAPS